MLVIPTQAIASQSISIQLAGQSCQINLYAKTANFDPQYGIPSTVLFCDLYVQDVPIVQAVPCFNANLIVRDAYLGFIGDLIFIDTLNLNADPTFDLLGARYQLVYMEASDLAALGLPA